MKESYQDIRSRIAEIPKWYDANGTPRYCDFAPAYCPLIYALTVVLLEIQCQCCPEKFLVEVHEATPSCGVLAKEIARGSIRYGDPPYHACSGDCMCPTVLRVVEYWAREPAHPISGWVRHPEMEVPIEQPGGTDEVVR